MKEIRAIIRPSRLEKLRSALRLLPHFPGLTVFKGEGFTAPATISKRSDAEELTDYSPKLMICVLAEENHALQIEEIIIEQCRTGQVGDGLVWTVDVSSAVRIRNGSKLESN